MSVRAFVARNPEADHELGVRDELGIVDARVRGRDHHDVVIGGREWDGLERDAVRRERRHVRVVRGEPDLHAEPVGMFDRKLPVTLSPPPS